MKQSDYPQPPRGLTSAELDRVEANVSEVLAKVTDRMTHSTWADGIAWYGNAHRFARTLATEYGHETVTVAWVIALLSPQNRWVDNRTDARSILSMGQCRALPLGQERSLRILGGEEPEAVAGGRKVRAFGRNIAHPATSLDVTLDTHMANALSLPPRYLERVGVYDTISKAFREKANEHCILPHQLQAAVWIHERGVTQ